jgi:arylsulfatase
VAASHPEKLAELKAEFDVQAKANHVYPIGAGLYPFLDPTARIATSQHEWLFSDRIQRLPEFAAPNLRNQNNRVTVEAVVPANASGVLYAMGGIGGGVSLYLDDGYLATVQRVGHRQGPLRSEQRVAAGTVNVSTDQYDGVKLARLPTSVCDSMAEVGRALHPSPALTFTAARRSTWPDLVHRSPSTTLTARPLRSTARSTMCMSRTCPDWQRPSRAPRDGFCTIQTS